MSKLRDKSEQIITLWEKTGMKSESREEQIEVLENAFKLVVDEVLQWASKPMKMYETAWDEGQMARKFMSQARVFRENM